jgi:hypothetical protein
LSAREDGTYPGNIVAAYVAEDQWAEGEYVLKLDVNLEGGGAVTCRQSLSSGEKKVKDKRDSVLRSLELAYPFGSADLAGLTGRSIDVNLKTSAKGRQNAYIATAREERVLSPEELDKVFTGRDELPF